MTASIHSELAALQSTSSCTRGNFLVFQWASESGINGFAAMFQFYASSLAVAFALNRTLIEALPPPVDVAGWTGSVEAATYIRSASKPSRDPWPRAPAAACGGLKAACFFEPSSSCVFVGDVNHVVPLDPQGRHQGDRVVRIDSLADYHDIIMTATRGDVAPAYVKQASGCSIGDAFVSTTRSSATSPADTLILNRHSRCRSRIWFPAIQSFLFKPVARIRNQVQQQVAAMTSAQHSFAIHVRRGDAAKLTWRSHSTVDTYVERAQALLLLLQRTSSSLHVSSVADRDDRTAQQRTWAAPSLYLATDSASTRHTAALLVNGSFALLESPALIFQTRSQQQHHPETSSGASPPEDAHIHTESYIAQALAWSISPLAETVDEVPAAQFPSPVPTASAANFADAVVDVLGIPVLALASHSEFEPATGTGDLEDEQVVQLTSADYHTIADVIQRLAEAGDSQTSASLQPGFRDHVATALTARSLTDGVIADIFALSHGNHFIGTCLSQVSRLAYELAYANGYSRSDPVGLDAAACRSWPRHFYSITADWREGFDVWSDD